MSKPDSSWWANSVFYQIYPRSFQDSNGDGIGDLQGIIERLDYLVELGIDAIWISPIFPSPMADFGYDVSDYTGIHPIFGNMETFDRLLREIHSRGLRLVLDFVGNHSSDQHPWFLEARASRTNPRHDWYIWRDPAANGGPPNNWESHFAGSAWEWDEHTHQYYLHLFLKQQPDLNWENPQVVDAMHNMLRFWLDKGVDGFRMDVITFLAKHPDMPDNPIQTGDDGKPYQEHRYDINQPRVHDFIRGIRRVFDSYPGERVTIGETWFLDPKALVQWYGENLDELHIPFNFNLLKTDWNAQQMKRSIAAYYAALPSGAVPNFVLGNHDTRRLATRFGIENHRSAGMLLLTLRGIPTLYYGDELGMQDVTIPPERWQDPEMFHKPGTDKGRDPERTPMQWSTGSNAGFCSPDVQPWLPLADDYSSANVEFQRADPQSTLNFYKALLRLRRELPALRQGDFQLIESNCLDVLAYLRTSASQQLLVIINFSGEERRLGLSWLASKAFVLLASRFRTPGLVDLSDLVLSSNESLILEIP